MIFKIQHDSSYTYSRPVCLDPHLLRLRPRTDGTQRILRYVQQIRPKPVGLTEFTDLEGNAAAEAWFEGPTSQLLVSTEIVVETLRVNPFDFIVTEPEMLTLPARYSDPLELSLGVYCQPMRASGPVAEFADGVAQECAGRTTEFLLLLCQRVRDACKYTVRESGVPQPPEMTLDLQTGACRDLALLYIEGCRSQGLAARFTSGYHTGTNGNGARRCLHAWAEVYLPGAGWRGYDPTYGVAAAEQHVPLASSLVPSGTAAVQGTYWGADVTSSLRVNIVVTPE